MAAARCAAASRLAAFGLTEPEAGSDAGNTRTTARLEDGEWVINGAKQFITNSGTDISGCVTITAVTGASNGHKEISNIIVPNGTPGLRGRRALPQDGLERLRHAAAVVRGLPRARGEPARPARRRLQAVPAHPRRRAHRRRRRWASASRRARSTRRSPTRRSARRSASRSRSSRRSRPSSPTCRPRSRPRGC